MKLIFIDESEKQQSSKKIFFCLCSLMVDKEQLFIVEDKLREIKEKYSLDNFKVSVEKNTKHKV